MNKSYCPLFIATQLLVLTVLLKNRKETRIALPNQLQAKLNFTSINLFGNWNLSFLRSDSLCVEFPSSWEENSRESIDIYRGYDCWYICGEERLAVSMTKKSQDKENYQSV